MNTNILIVDDNDNNLYSLEKIILEYIDDVCVLKANSGDVALEIAYKQQIDLIILDIQMPIMDGFDIAKYLNVNPKTRQIPIIFLTAVFKKEEFVQKGFSLGAIDYLTKPLEETKLINQIKLYIRILNKDRLLNNQIKEETEKLLKHERILFLQSKMITMGEMMSNIAHQWRQPLSAIVNTIDYIKLRCNNDTISSYELLHELDNIAENSLFLSQTIDTFRNFFKEDQITSNFYLSSIIDKTLAIIEKNLNFYNIQVIKNITHTSINSHKQYLQHAILNIINNAKDVLSEKKETKQKFIFIDVIDNNHNIIIKIKDNGGGISDDIIDKIYEPYFTTKHKSQGTGIGLYMTYQIIVTNMKGSLKVSNQKYSYNNEYYIGAEFVIEIPKIGLSA